MNKQMILNLILRDFRAYSWRIINISILVLVIGMFMIFINTHLDRMFEGGISLIVIAVIVPFFNELKNRSVWIHTASLPVSRKAIVITRFIISIGIVTVNLIIWVFAFNILAKLLHTDPKYVISGGMIFYGWMGLLLNLAIFYFIFFRFNFIVAMLFYLFMMFVFPFLRAGLSKDGYFMHQNFEQTSLASIVIGIIFIGSVLFSIMHFQKKDL